SLSSLTALASHVIYTLSLHDALPIWVDAARVGDDLDLLLQGQREAVLELAEEGLGVTELGALHPVAAEDEHGELGEVVAGEDVEFAALEHLAHRGDAVAVEPGHVSDPQWGAVHGHARAPFSRPPPGSPANAWAIRIQPSASSPTA